MDDPLGAVILRLEAIERQLVQTRVEWVEALTAFRRATASLQAALDADPWRPPDQPEPEVSLEEGA